jgi:hypothetical protein
MNVTTMPDIKEYVTVLEAAEHPDVSYTPYWLRHLCNEGLLDAIKVEGAARGTWLIHLPSLLKYAQEMQRLGTDKHDPRRGQ